MKAKSARTMALLLVCIVLALPATALATPPEPLTIGAELWLTGQDTAEGYFWTYGLFEDGGYASEVFFIAAETIHGTKTLVGAQGAITLNFQAQITWTGDYTAEVNGRYVIVSGTGAYEKLHGTAFFCLDGSNI